MLEGYKIIKELGAGGFGKVYLAKEEISERLVAIKAMKKSDKDEAFDDARHEIKIISQFYHPNIVIYHNTLKKDDRIYFVME